MYLGYVDTKLSGRAFRAFGHCKPRGGCFVGTSHHKLSTFAHSQTIPFIMSLYVHASCVIIPHTKRTMRDIRGYKPWHMSAAWKNALRWDNASTSYGACECVIVVLWVALGLLSCLKPHCFGSVPQIGHIMLENIVFKTMYAQHIYILVRPGVKRNRDVCRECVWHISGAVAKDCGRRRRTAENQPASMRLCHVFGGSSTRGGYISLCPGCLNHCLIATSWPKTDLLPVFCMWRRSITFARSVRGLYIKEARVKAQFMFFWSRWALFGYVVEQRARGYSKLRIR